MTADASDGIQKPNNGTVAPMALHVPVTERRASVSEPMTPSVLADLGQKPTASAVVKAKVKAGLQRCHTMMKDSPLTVLGLSAKHNPKIAEIVDQARVLCEDYIFGRMLRGGELTGNENPSELSDVIKLSDVSREIQLIGTRLESTYPQLYQNVSRQVNMPLKPEIMKAFRMNQTTRTLWILTLLGTLAGFVFTWITAMQI